MMHWITDSNGDHVLKIDGRERARLPFLPPEYPARELTEIGMKQEMERILGFVPEPATLTQWWMIGSTTLSGQLGMIVSWHWANIDFERVLRGVALIPDLVGGETDNFTCDDWSIFADALRNYAEEMTPTQRQVFAIARAGAAGELPFGSTKAFPDYPGD